MYVSAAFLGTASQGVWSTARLLGGVESRSCTSEPHPRTGAAVGGHAGPVQNADQGKRFEGQSVSVTGPHGLGHAGRLTAQGNVGCVRRAAVQRRKLHGRVHHGRTPRAQSPASSWSGTPVDTLLPVARGRQCGGAWAPAASRPGWPA